MASDIEVRRAAQFKWLKEMAGDCRASNQGLADRLLPQDNAAELARLTSQCIVHDDAND